jgi:hypothetical protein
MPRRGCGAVRLVGEGQLPERVPACVSIKHDSRHVGKSSQCCTFPVRFVVALMAGAPSASP